MAGTKSDAAARSWRDDYEAWRHGLRRDRRYRYNAEAAERPVTFIERFGSLGGDFAGQPFALADWQKFILRDLYGYRRRSDGRRRFRIAYLELGRGAGKSQLAAAIGLYGLAGEGTADAEVYSAASSTSQANVSFGSAKDMVARSRRLAAAVTTYRYSLAHRKSGSLYRVLSADARHHYGLRPTLTIFDELHAQPNRELWDALGSAHVKRRDSLLLAITNAGVDRTSICYELRERSERVLRGQSADESLYPGLFGAYADAPWDDETLWRRCHPGLGTTIGVEDLRREAAAARETPALIPRFERLYLSRWTQATETWADLDAWDRCAQAPTPPEEELRECPCYLGLDLSTSDDLSALAAVWALPGGKMHARTWQWMTAESAARHEQSAGTPYARWAAESARAGDGRLTLIDAPVIDRDAILDKASELAGAHDVRCLAYDAYRAGGLTAALEAEGLPCVPVRQAFSGVGPAMAEIGRRLKDASLALPADPLLRWQASNVEVKADDAGNMRPVKRAARGKYAGTPGAKIDGFMAVLFGVSRAMLQGAGEPQPRTFGFAWA